MFRARRRRRAYERRLGAAGRTTGPGPRDWSASFEPSPPPRHRRLNRRWSIAVAAVLVFVLVGGAGYVLQGLRQLGIPLEDTPLAAVYADARPAPGREVAPRPLGTPPPPPAGAGGYAFLRTVDGEPVAYDPCRPIHYVIRSHGETDDMRRAVRDGIRAASAATGLRFIADGSTSEKPSEQRVPYQPDVYGQRWAPVLIAFSDGRESPKLGRKAVGFGGSTAVPHGTLTENRETYVSGALVLDTPALRKTKGEDRYRVTRHVVEHELGHVLGLDHVDDERQLMFPRASRKTTYGPGDLRGLARLGQGPCAPDL